MKNSTPNLQKNCNKKHLLRNHKTTFSNNKISFTVTLIHLQRKHPKSFTFLFMISFVAPT